MPVPVVPHSAPPFLVSLPVTIPSESDEQSDQPKFPARQQDDFYLYFNRVYLGFTHFYESEGS